MALGGDVALLRGSFVCFVYKSDSKIDNLLKWAVVFRIIFIFRRINDYFSKKFSPVAYGCTTRIFCIISCNTVILS